MRGDYKKIDVNKLKALFKKRGITKKTAGLELGFSGSYFNNVFARGRIAKSGILLLERIYGIKEEEYVVQEEKEQECEIAESKIDYDKLYEVIYTAVYQAVKMAWKEC